MTTGLVGYTGFVGSNLRRQREFDELYNSYNIDDIRGRSFDRLVFSAAKAEKWRINQDPEADAAHIAELIDILRSVDVKHLVLISTVDVYGSPEGVDELTAVDEHGLHAYGLHRRALEKYVVGEFSRSTILRLPGLFGPGIKKNVIYDLLHGNNLDRVHADGSYQYYDLRLLADDVDRAVSLGIPLLNVSTEPITTQDLAREAFGVDFQNRPEDVAPGSYDMKSVYASSWGGEGGYLYDRRTILSRLRDFVVEERG